MALRVPGKGLRRPSSAPGTERGSHGRIQVAATGASSRCREYIYKRKTVTCVHNSGEKIQLQDELKLKINLFGILN